MPINFPTAPAGKVALFIKHGRFSGINASLLSLLKTGLPEYAWRERDVVTDWLAASPALRAVNVLASFWAFRRHLTTRRCALHDVYIRTPFMFRTLKRLASREVAQSSEPVALTFSTQSMFDVSVPGTPHFIFTDHTHLANLYYPAFSPADLLPSFVPELERVTYANARRIFVMGSHVARSLGEHYQVPAHRAVVCGGGSNFTDPPPLENAGYGSRSIGFVGIDWERKGGPALLRAFSQVRAELPDATLHVVGCRPQEPVQGVTWHGRLEPSDVARVLSRTSVFAFPTLIEPFGLAPIEAASMGLPVVASTVGAMPDIVRHEQTGLLVPPGQEAPLAEALIRLLSQPALCAEFGRAASLHAKNQFTWEAAGARVCGAIAQSLSAERHTDRLSSSP